uniref:Uncharacterized protein n=1 Tax=Arundo donax TaxID=35708 RepID=A0A0A9E072_ARUDO
MLVIQILPVPDNLKVSTDCWFCKPAAHKCRCR